LAGEFNINSIPTLMIIRDATVLFSKAGMLPEKVLTDLVAQARKVDMEKVRSESVKNQPASQAAAV
jgi:thioredoxin 1